MLFPVRLPAAAPRPVCRRQGGYRIVPIPKGTPKTDGTSFLTALRCRPLGSAPGVVPLDSRRDFLPVGRVRVRRVSRVPTGALSCVQVAPQHTTGQLAQAMLFRPGSNHRDRRPNRAAMHEVHHLIPHVVGNPAGLPIRPRLSGAPRARPAARPSPHPCSATWPPARRSAAARPPPDGPTWPAAARTPPPPTRTASSARRRTPSAARRASRTPPRRACGQAGRNLLDQVLPQDGRLPGPGEIPSPLRHRTILRPVRLYRCNSNGPVLQFRRKQARALSSGFQSAPSLLYSPKRSKQGTCDQETASFGGKALFATTKRATRR